MTKYVGKGAKISILKSYSELEKNWKLIVAFSKIPILHLFYELEKTWKYTVRSPRPTFQNPNFEKIDELGKVMS